jgi:hypothetical protein
MEMEVEPSNNNNNKKKPDILQLQKHLRPDQFQQLQTSFAKFIKLNDDPSVSLTEVKSSRTFFLKLLSHYSNQNSDNIDRVKVSLDENERNAFKSTEAIGEIKTNLKENKKQLLVQYERYTKDSYLLASHHDQLKVHLDKLNTHYKVITELKEQIIELQQEKQLRKREYSDIKLQYTILEKSLTDYSNNNIEIALFKSLFSISYTDDQVIEDRHNSKGDSITMIPDDDVYVVTSNKRPRTTGPGIDLPPTKLLAEAIDPTQCIYRKDADTLVKILPENSATTFLYFEMSALDGFVKIIDSHNENEFPVDTYEICPDMKPANRVTLLTLSDNIHGIPVGSDGNHMEKFCILYELLDTLQTAYKENRFRYNTSDYNTLKYEKVEKTRPYENEKGKILCSSKKKVLITDLSKSFKELKPTSKKARLDANDVALFQSLIRQLRIPNFTHKIIGLLSKAPTDPLIGDFTKSFKAAIKKEKKKKKKIKKSNNAADDNSKKESYIRFDRFINAIGDAWLNHNF